MTTTKTRREVLTSTLPALAAMAMSPTMPATNRVQSVGLYDAPADRDSAYTDVMLCRADERDGLIASDPRLAGWVWLRFDANWVALALRDNPIFDGDKSEPGYIERYGEAYLARISEVRQRRAAMTA
jgi:hypothetical protein